jgi:hypothetical protein
MGFIHPIDKRFLMIKQSETTEQGPRKIIIVLNWLEELVLELLQILDRHPNTFDYFFIRPRVEENRFPCRNRVAVR